MKRVLLIDAVEFPPESTGHPLSSVSHWFCRSIDNAADVAVEVIPSSSPQLSEAAARSDALIFSGSPRDAWANSPDVLALLAFLQQTVSRNQPILGVCFGHQLLARALGGQVERDPKGWEVGECSVHLTPDGLQSPLFADIDSRVHVIESHRDAVLSLPPGARLLASNEHTPIQAFSMNERFFGVQFHPEMNGDILRHLWLERREKLRDTIGFDLDHALDSAGSPSQPSRVFTNFFATLS